MLRITPHVGIVTSHWHCLTILMAGYLPMPLVTGQSSGEVYSLAVRVLARNLLPNGA